jgi:hypothetical protein
MGHALPWTHRKHQLKKSRRHYRKFVRQWNRSPRLDQHFFVHTGLLVVDWETTTTTTAGIPHQRQPQHYHHHHHHQQWCYILVSVM